MMYIFILNYEFIKAMFKFSLKLPYTQSVPHNETGTLVSADIQLQVSHSLL